MNGNDCSVCRKTESDALFDKRSQKNVNDYSSELFSLKSKALKIRKSVCDLDDVIGMIQASTQLQDQKIESLEAFCQKTEEFIADTVRIDEEAAAVINQSKEDFYNQYNYLRPDAEKSDWEAFWDNAAEWCAEHWKEIVTTVTIIIGAALAIAAVVTTGGAALVPLLSTLLTAIGVSAGTAMTAATIISFTVAAIAVGSTIGSSALNIIDTWGNIDNPTFNTWQSVLNWTSIISNGLYSAGNIYNSVKGVTPKEYLARQKAIENGKAGYSNLEAKHPKMKHKSGENFDGARKREILQENMRRNNGILRSDKTGKILEKPQKSVKGIKHPANEAQIDHIFPKAKGGMNSFSNAQVIEAFANRVKSDQLMFSDYMKYSIADVGSWNKAFCMGFYENVNGIVDFSFLYND